jgi:hypothetical protein
MINVYNKSIIQKYKELIEDKTLTGKEFTAEVKKLYNTSPNDFKTQLKVTQSMLNKLHAEDDKLEVGKSVFDILNYNNETQILASNTGQLCDLLNSIAIEFIARNVSLDPSVFDIGLNKSRERWYLYETFDYNKYYRNPFLIPVRLVMNNNLSNQAISFYLSGKIWVNTQHFEILASKYLTTFNPVMIEYAAQLFSEIDGSPKQNITRNNTGKSLERFKTLIDQLSANYLTEDMSIDELNTLMPPYLKIK